MKLKAECLIEELQQIEYVRNLPGLTPEVWARYEALEIKGLREQNLLEDAIQKFNKTFGALSDICLL